ncbi:hypothetical protein QRX50_20170 [Amycolatopsis carbonis]|uniref:Uncharacterized protein n=1 Tax=Amycolatopsis carbonis TaxID=715471 RepID=A0A9Y2MY02_9PSEU|nr:hypothetical protein [Amycolatopsis sp. 2-15]WIX82916.1 hypothetical protein QRX50_20170 [Amycolatopsis sp. 2-15]
MMIQAQRRHFVLCIVAVCAVACVVVAGYSGIGGSVAQASHTNTGSSDLITPADEELENNAEQLLVEKCMIYAGFQTWPRVKLAATPQNLYPYVIDDVQWARRHGFGSDIQQSNAQTAAADPNVRYFSGLSDIDRKRATTALNGPLLLSSDASRVTVAVPSGGSMSRSTQGCTSESEQELYGNLADWFRVDATGASLNMVRYRMVINDATYVATVKRWASCMDRTGYHHVSPSEAMAAFIGPAVTPTRQVEQRALEISTATAEASCSEQTSLRDVS